MKNIYVEAACKPAAICLFVRPSDSLLKLYPLFALRATKQMEIGQTNGRE